jgi:hypothetical protein
MARQQIPRPHIFAEIAGWYGTVAIVLAYVSVSFGELGAGGLTYQLLNLTGALGIMTIALVKHVRQSVVLNVFWGGIAAAAIVHILVG